MRHNLSIVLFSCRFRCFALFVAMVLLGHPVVAAPQQSDAIDESWMKTIHEGEGAPSAPENGGDPKAKSESPPPSEAAKRGEALFQSPEAPPSFFEVVLKFVVMMGVMLGFLYGVLRFLKSRSGSLMAGGELMRVVASLPLIGGKQLQIIDLAGKLYVLGVSDHGVNLITSVEDARTVEKIRLYEASRASFPASDLFSTWTRKLKGVDLKFWGGKEDAERDRFRELLRQETGGGDEDAGSDYLNELLNRQKRKIERLKNKTDLS